MLHLAVMMVTFGRMGVNNMKTILILLFATLLFGQSIQQRHLSIIKKRVAAAETYTFHIEFDSDTDWGTGGYTMGGEDYSAGDQSGTVTGNLAQNSGEITAVSGTYVLKNTSSIATHIAFDNSSEDIFNPDLGYLRMNVYPIATINTCSLFDITFTVATSCDFAVKIQSDSTVKLDFRDGDGGTSHSLTTTATVSSGQFNIIDIRWDVANNTRGIRIGGGTWLNSAVSLSAFDGTAATFMILGLTASNGDFYMDDVTVWPNFTGPGD